MPFRKTYHSIALTITAIVCVSLQAMALETGYYANSSRLSSGHWVKVKVSDSGIYRISHEQLRQWGFDDPSKVNVYGFGGPELADNTFSTDMPDDLPLQYCEHISDALLFYGEGDLRLRPRSNSTTDLKRRRNHYCTYSCYFLSDVKSDRRPASAMPFTENEAAINEHLSFDYIEPEEYQPDNAGVNWFADPLYSTAEKRTFTFHAVDYTGEAAVTWLPVTNSTSQITVEPVTEAASIEVLSRRGVMAVRPVTSDRTYLLYNSLPSPSYLQIRLIDGHTDFPVTFSGHVSAEWVSIDYACLIYKRRNRLGSHPQLIMNIDGISASANLRVSDAGSNTCIWDVTRPLSVTPLETRYDAATTSISATPPMGTDPMTLVAFNPDDASLPVPEFLGTVDHNSDLHATPSGCEMVIITSSSLMPAAQRLATLHEARQGLQVNVVDHQQIFDEFSSGAPSAIAYRRYVKMLHDREPGRLKYLLLFGHGTSDHRFLTVDNDGSYLFTYQVEEDREIGYTDWSNYRVSNFSSDNYFGMLDDSFTIRSIPSQHVSIGVGRLPVSGMSQAEDMIDKIEEYFDSYMTDDHHSRMLALADGGDQNAHLLMADNAVDIMHAHQPAIAADKVYHALFRTSPDDNKNMSLWKSRLDESLAEGAGLMGFCGHAATTSFATAFTLPSISKMVFNNHPICLFATCEALYIDRPVLNMGMEMLRDRRGAVAIIAAGRTVYLNRNKTLYDAVIDNYYSVTSGDCLGDVWRNAFNDVITGNDISYGINSLSYNLGGDPALPVARPTHGASVLTVNGAQAGSTVRISALSPVTLSGTVTNLSGAIASDFNGRAVVTIYDGTQTVTTPDIKNGDSSVNVKIDNRVLARTGAEVKNGRWTATLVPPVGSVPHMKNRVLVWASDGHSGMALGAYDGLSVADPVDASSPSDDTSGPEITAMYIDTPEFSDGDATGSDFTLYAEIAPDPSGINVSNSTVCRRAGVTLDSRSTTSMSSNTLRWQPDGSARMVYPFTGVTDGHHTVTVSVADNLGNVSERTVSFSVINATLTGHLAVADPIVTGRTQISLDIPSSAEVTRVVVEDAQHNAVEVREHISWPWNWTPAANLPDGHYSIRVYFKDSSRYGATDPLEITLIRGK